MWWTFLSSSFSNDRANCQYNPVVQGKDMAAASWLCVTTVSKTQHMIGSQPSSPLWSLNSEQHSDSSVRTKEPMREKWIVESGQFTHIKASFLRTDSFANNPSLVTILSATQLEVAQRWFSLMFCESNWWKLLRSNQLGHVIDKIMHLKPELYYFHCAVSTSRDPPEKNTLSLFTLAAHIFIWSERTFVHTWT